MWNTAYRAIRSNSGPGLVLWAIAGLVVALYYLVPFARPAFETVAAWKTNGGFLFSIISTAVFAGAIPALVTRSAWRPAVFLVLFWGYRGIEIDLLYQFQSALFGATPSLGTIAAKVAVDLLIYNVVWAVNLQLVTYQWSAGGFRLSAFTGWTWRRYLRERYIVALLSTWVIWLPVVTLVYCLPGPLQIPLFNIAACFWALVVTTLTKRADEPGKPVQKM